MGKLNDYELPKVRLHPAHESRTYRIKRDAEERLAMLMSHAYVIDDMKEGNQFPEDRLRQMLHSVESLRRKLKKITETDATTPKKQAQKEHSIEFLQEQFYQVKEEALQLWNDMPTDMSNEDLALEVIRVMRE
jgi:hypothetical protein